MCKISRAVLSIFNPESLNQYFSGKLMPQFHIFNSSRPTFMFLICLVSLFGLAIWTGFKGYSSCIILPDTPGKFRPSPDGSPSLFLSQSRADMANISGVKATYRDRGEMLGPAEVAAKSYSRPGNKPYLNRLKNISLGHGLYRLDVISEPLFGLYPPTYKAGLWGGSLCANTLWALFAVILGAVFICSRFFWRNKSLGRKIEDMEKVENALRLAESRYRDIFENATDGIYQSTPEGEFIRVNMALARMLKYDSPQDMLACIKSIKHDFYTSPETRERFLRKLEQANRVDDLQVQVNCKDGSTRWVSENARSVFDSSGNPEYFEGIVRDISRRKEVDEALIKAKEAAEEANQAKSDFLANISHEIRTPLSAIQGMSELLRERAGDAEEKNMAGIIHSSAVNLLDIINDLLDLSKIDANRFRLHYEEIDLPDFCSRLVDTYSLPAEKKGLEFVARIEDIPEYVWVDKVRLRQVLSNLIGNSLKFTEKGRIVFAVHREGEDEQGMCGLTFSVSDTGIGVPELELEKIFKAFEQSSAAYNHHMRGTGLGLSLSQKFIQLMGGEGISITSRESRGSTFQFSLSLKPGDGSNVKKEKSREEPNGYSGLSALRILAAEDNYVNRELLQKMFETLDIREYMLAENGGEVVNILEKDPGYWDVVLLDLEMPVMDGRKVAERMRAREIETGIVIMSAHAQEDTREKCRRLGVRDFISKPYSLNRLREVLQRFVQRETVDHAEQRSVQDICRNYLKREYAMPEDDIQEIIRATAENMKNSLQSMDNGLKGGDFKVVRRDAHYIKGMLANIGLVQLSGLAGNIQKAAEQGREDDCRVYLDRLWSQGKEFLKND